MEYISPGDAFSSSLEQSLFMRAQAERQAQMDQLAMQRELRQQRQDAQDAAEAKEALAEKRREFAENQKDKRKGAFEKTVGNMMPGDIPSPDLIGQAKEFGLSHLFPEAQPDAPESMPGIAAVPVGESQQGLDPTRTGAVTNPESQLGGMRFIGSAKQRTEQNEQADAMALVAEMPDGPQKQALQTAIRLHIKPTVDMFKPQGDDTQPIARVDSKRNVVERLVDGVWTPVTGNVPKGTHFVQEPTPPQVNPFAKDNHDLRVDAARDRAYQHAVTELNKVSTPYEAKLAELDAVDGVLNERTTGADAHVAPMVLKALVAGQGSGFRMTQAEISQVQNARTKWQSMEAAFNKWQADPKKALFFDESQRAEFQKLIDMMRAATQRHLEPVMKARHDIDAAKEPADIQKRMTDMHESRSKGSKDDKADTSSKPFSLADIKAEFGTPKAKK